MHNFTKKAIKMALFSILLACQRDPINSNTAQIGQLNDVSTFDVSILYSIPKAATRDFYISPKSISSIDNKVIMNLPESMLDREDKNALVVGIRLDPCFPALTNDLSKCHPNIRFVMQPVGVGATRIEDTAFHVFYKMTSEDLYATVQEIKNLRESLDINSLNGLPLDQVPLQVHPGMKNIQFLQGLKSIILSKIKAENMHRVTSTIGQSQSMWDFKGNDIAVDGSKTPMVIGGLKPQASGLPHTSQIFFFDRDFSANAFTPTLQANDNIEYLASINFNDMNNGDVVKLEQSAIAAVKIENPTIHSPETTDCVSCHVAGATVKKSQSVVDANVYVNFKFQNAADLNLDMLYVTELSYINMRMFGYLEKKPFISQRTINETAAIVEYIRKR